MFTKEIEVQEYEKSSISTLGRKSKAKGKKQHLRFNLYKLFWAIARTTTNSNIGNIKRAFLAFSNAIGSIPIIDWNCRDFRLTDCFGDSYRDFSKTSRVGELSQGVNYLFAQDILKYDQIMDFDEFCKLKKISIPTKSKTPDFIVENSTNRNLGIIESKGQFSSDSSYGIKAPLKKGLDQCKIGRGIIKTIKPKNSFSSLVMMKSSSAAANSRICYVDPENEETGELDLGGLNYYSLFLLSGMHDQAKAIVQGDNIPLIKDSDHLQINDQPFVIWRYNYQNEPFLTDVIYELEFFFRHTFRRNRQDILFPSFGINKSVYDFLTGDTQSFNLSKFQQSYDRDKKCEYTLFRDGTLWPG